MYRLRKMGKGGGLRCAITESVLILRIPNGCSACSSACMAARFPVQASVWRFVRKWSSARADASGWNRKQEGARRSSSPFPAVIRSLHPGPHTEMSDSGKDGTEIERLHTALEAETRACLDVQRRLDRANADFEEFVSIAAHNLREPLRDVASFSQLLAETYAPQLDSEAGVLFGRVRDGAVRMQSLLADMVDYWELHAGGETSSRADMEAVLRQALLCAGKQITESSAVVTHDPLPQVCGDFAVLTKVLHHLIRNAIEYCDTPSPRVHISSKRQDLDWVVSVHDNGPGIDPAFQERIFGVFKRLHGKAYPGNGLGLAFCKKAIEGYGGRIWVESTPGAGSTFCFTLSPPVIETNPDGGSAYDRIEPG